MIALEYTGACVCSVDLSPTVYVANINMRSSVRKLQGRYGPCLCGDRMETGDIAARPESKTRLAR